MELNGKKIGPDAIFMYRHLTHCALKANEMNLTKKMFINFASEIWDSMLLTDPEELKDILLQLTLERAQQMTKKG